MPEIEDEPEPWGDDDYWDPPVRPIVRYWFPDDFAGLFGIPVRARLLDWADQWPDDRLPCPVRYGYLSMAWSTLGFWTIAVDGHPVDGATVEPIGCHRPKPTVCHRAGATVRQRRWAPS